MNNNNNNKSISPINNNNNNKDNNKDNNINNINNKSNSEINSNSNSNSNSSSSSSSSSSKRKRIHNTHCYSKRERLKIVLEAVEDDTPVSFLAEKYGISVSTVRKYVKEHRHEIEAAAPVKEENIKSILAYMDSRKGQAANFIQKVLTEINDSEKIANTSIRDLAVAMGIVIDKYTAPNVYMQQAMDSDGFVEAINAGAKDDWQDDKHREQADQEQADAVSEGEQ